MIAVEASSDALRKECMKALESGGTAELLHFKPAYFFGDPLKRDAQEV